MPGILKVPYAALGTNGYYKITPAFYVRSANFAKNKNAQFQKICSFKKKTICIFEFSTTKLGKNKCRYQCNKNCVPSVMIILPKLNSLTPPLNVDCSAGSIKIATKVKYFGIIIDDKLNFKDHINFV